MKHGVGYRRQRRVIAAFLGPPLFLLAGLTVIPFAFCVYLSLHAMDLSTPETMGEFVGWDNYRGVLQGDPGFESAMIVTSKFVAIAVLLETLLGLLLAAYLQSLTPRIRRVMMAIVVLPMMMAPVAVALMWLFLLQPDYGLATHALAALGLENTPVLANPRTALFVVCCVDVWEWTPFTTLVFWAGIAAIPRPPVDAAKIDGLSVGQRIENIYWPKLRGIVGIAVLLRLLDAIKVFDIVYILTGGGPGDATEVTSTYIYRATFRETDFGAGAAQTVILYYIILCVCGVVFHASQGRERLT